MGNIASAIDSQSAFLCGQERWAKHKELVSKFWERIADCLDTIDASGIKIYQDGLPVDGDLAKRIIEQTAKGGSKNHRIILTLIERGAKVMKTEDVSLLQEEYRNIVGLVQSKSAIERNTTLTSYELRKNQLTKKRDKFIARRINETLKEGQTGVLFMGSYHNVILHLPKDIMVQHIKKRDKINAYFKELISKGGGKRFEQLAQYLVQPCACSWNTSA